MTPCSPQKPISPNSCAMSVPYDAPFRNLHRHFFIKQSLALLSQCSQILSSSSSHKVLSLPRVCCNSLTTKSLKSSDFQKDCRRYQPHRYIHKKSFSALWIKNKTTQLNNFESLLFWSPYFLSARKRSFFIDRLRSSNSCFPEILPSL